MTYRIAHFSDLHLGLDHDDFDRIEFLLADALARGANHIVITGDLLDHGNHHDLRWLKASLRRLGLWDAKRVTVVPGNHDVIGGTSYANRIGAITDSRAKRKQRLQAFTRAFTPLEMGVQRVGRSRYPYMKRLGQVAIISVNSVDTAYFAQGLVGEGQIARLSELLRALKRSKALPIVAMHHRPIDVPADELTYAAQLFHVVTGGSMNLVGAEDVIAAISEGGGDLVLCGHWHDLGDAHYTRASGVRVFTQGRSGGMDQEPNADDGEVVYSYDLLTIDGGLVRRRTIEFEGSDIDAEIQ